MPEEFNANAEDLDFRIPPGGALAIQLRDEHGEWWGLIPDLANIYVDANPDTDIRVESDPSIPSISSGGDTHPPVPEFHQAELNAREWQQQMTIERLEYHRLHGLRDEYTSPPKDAFRRARVCLREVLGDWSYLRYRIQGFVRKRASDGEVWTFYPGKFQISGETKGTICQADTGRGLPDDDRLATLLLFFRMGPEGERLLKRERTIVAEETASGHVFRMGWRR